jgi:hypothetical protein
VWKQVARECLHHGRSGEVLPVLYENFGRLARLPEAHWPGSVEDFIILQGTTPLYYIMYPAAARMIVNAYQSVIRK